MKYFIFILLVFLCTFGVPAELEAEELEQFKEDVRDGNGLSTETLIRFNDMTASEREEIFSEIPAEKAEAFWEQFLDDESFTSEMRNTLFNELPRPERKKFMDKYAKEYGISLEGFDVDTMGFGSGGVLGTSEGYFDMERLKKYNAAAEDKITGVKYSEVDGVRSMVFLKESGASLTMDVKEGERGFYFDIPTGQIGRVNTDGVTDYSDPFSGSWNGNGKLTISPSDDGGAKFGLDYADSIDGKSSKDPANFARFERANGEAYSVYKHPTGEENDDGSRKFDLVGGKVEFGSDGKLKKIHNMYKEKSGDKDWGGYYGEDINVAYTSEEFKKLTDGETSDQARLMIEEKSNGKMDVSAVAATEKSGIINDASVSLKSASNKLDEVTAILSKQQKDNFPSQSEIEDLGFFDKGKFELRKFAIPTQAAKEIGLGEFLPDGTKNQFYNKETYKDAVGFFSRNPAALSDVPGIKDDSRSQIIAQNIQQQMDTPNGLFENLESLTTVGSEVSSFFSSQADIFAESTDNPFLNNEIQTKSSRMDMILSIENVDNLKVSGVDVLAEDNSGNLVRVLKAPANIKQVPSVLNTPESSFSGVDININGNFQMKSTNGDLYVEGFEKENSLNTYRKGDVWVQANVYSSQGVTSEVQHAISAKLDYGVSEIKDAQAFRAQATLEYDNLKKSLQNSDGSLSKSSKDRLDALKRDNSFKHEGILSSGPIEFSASSSRMSSVLDSFLSDGGQSTMNAADKKQMESLVLSRVLSGEGVKGRDISVTEVQSIFDSEIVKAKKFFRENPSSSITYSKKGGARLFKTENGKAHNIDSAVGDAFDFIPSGYGHLDASNPNNLRFDFDSTRINDKTFQYNHQTTVAEESQGRREGLWTFLKNWGDAPATKARVASRVKAVTAYQFANDFKSPSSVGSVNSNIKVVTPRIYNEPIQSTYDVSARKPDLNSVTYSRAQERKEKVRSTGKPTAYGRR
jgi:hypothetical protein